MVFEGQFLCLQVYRRVLHHPTPLDVFGLYDPTSLHPRKFS
jgi:hypothetical protein